MRIRASPLIILISHLSKHKTLEHDAKHQRDNGITHLLRSDKPRHRHQPCGEQPNEPSAPVETSVSRSSYASSRMSTLAVALLDNLWNVYRR
ncbi:hypothetical protein HID58_040814 [Brassica napus]|uniref:Uncharacterized protein n=1 Tax=Brassica napus TaxID=3708 RepID=A0ABQ8BAN5_BRANA|nr:hypothetical protein HID58_040814 [Brassica napus]